MSACVCGKVCERSLTAKCHLHNASCYVCTLSYSVSKPSCKQSIQVVGGVHH